MPREAVGIAKQRAKPGWPKRFLKALGRYGTVAHACKACGINRRTAEKRRVASPAFARAWERALQRFADTAERELFRRAIDGVTEPVYQGGKLVGTKQVYSDSLLIRVAEALKPEKYKRRTEIEHAVALPAVDAERQRLILQDPELARLACEMDARLAQLERHDPGYLRAHEDRLGAECAALPSVQENPASVVIDLTPSDESRINEG